MNFQKDNWLIHVFALLHAVVCLVCVAAGIADDIILTLLTMLLAILICLRGRMSVLFMSISVILVNVAGFLLGMGLAALIGLLHLSPFVVHPVSTFICTEIIGWGMEMFVKMFSSRYAQSSAPDARSLRWLLIAFVLILILRLVILVVTSDVLIESRNFLMEIILDYVFSCLAIVLVAEYAIRFREQAEKAAEDANLANFRYLKLKSQVNPHFLFNSLNVLNCMIQDQPREEASRYTHKLADIYRYMLKSEDEVTVRLRDEMEFVWQYVELLKIRFSTGLEVTASIPEESMQRSVVPCSVQMLIENATKHNSVSVESPLRIEIHTTENSVVVKNNIRPRLTEPVSTGLGIKYMRQQYKDIAGKSVIVRRTEELYTVIIPLL